MADLLLSEQNSVTTHLIQDPRRGQEVIKKVLEVRNPSKKQIRDFQFEFNILQNLDLENIRKPIELTKEEDREVAFFHFFEGVTIKKIIQTGKADLAFVLKTGIFLADIISQVHGKGVIHKSITSQNILYNLEKEKFCLIDFSHSSTFREKKHILGNPIYIEGDIAYISPEQTGRMNRRVDARSDMYSIGVVLYEMIIGSVPFADSDLLEVIHGHIAKKPELKVIFNHFPKPIGKIIQKLLSKEAEERYQSGNGLKYDLEKCLKEFQLERSIMDFEIASMDFTSELRISQKLYGRSKEVDLLNTAFADTLEGSCSAVMVSGYSGVGKSVLVHEVYQSISRAEGYFLKGKYDQMQRNIPYYAIAQALKEYVGFILTEPETQQKKIRKKIKTALGSEARLILDIVPALESVVGESPNVPELTGQEAQNRFNYVFQKLIRSIASTGHPVVMFIDDLQWADLASLLLISNILRDRSISGFLFVGAYRDNEVSNVHPLYTMLSDLESDNIQTGKIHLDSLTVDDVCQLLVDTLNLPLANVADLGMLIHQRTNGNAFYVNQLLDSLYAEGHLVFNTSTYKWAWDEKEVANLEISENVVNLLTSRLRRLDDSTQRLLQTASCIGNYFELDHLHALLSSQKLNLDLSLTTALQEEFIKPDDMGYSFIHDRIQQAVYSLIEPEYQKSTHLEIGRTLLKSLNGSEENIFEIVDQLNAGRELVSDPEEREYFARLNLRSGNNAKSSTAYDSALEYFNAALYFSNHNWQSNYELLLTSYSNAAEAAHLVGDYEAVERYAGEVIAKGETLPDKIPAYRIRIESLKAQNKLPQAVEKGLEVLEELGIRMPFAPSKTRVLFNLLQVKLTLAGRNIENLLELKKMSDPYKLASMQILVSIGPAIYWASPNLIPLTIFNMVRLSVKYGNANESTFAYSTYGLILCGVTGQINQGNRFGDLALKLSEEVNGPNQVKGIFNVYCFVNHWEHHLNESFAPFQRSFQLGLENGELEFAALSGYLYCNHNLYSGRNLKELDQEMAVYSEEIKRIKQNTPLNYNLIHWQAVKCLIGVTDNPIDFNGPAYFVDEMLDQHHEAKDHTALFKYHLVNQMIYCIYHRYEDALVHAQEGKKYLEAVMGMFVTPVFYFYYGICLSGNEISRQKRSGKNIRKLSAIVRRFRKWAKYCPENHEHRYYLLLARYYILTGSEDKTNRAFSKAIETAGKNGFIQDKALICEMAGEYYYDRNESSFANHFLKSAYESYSQWGASRKCEELIEKYRLYDKLEVSFEQMSVSAPSAASGQSLQNVDIHTVIKASNAIAADIEYENLKTILLNILIENIGAERGVLLVPENGELKVAKQWPDSNEINYAESVVSLVERSKEILVSANAVNDQKLAGDPHILGKKVKSVLSFPVIHQGELLAVIYLENNLVQGAFSDDRLELLKLLSGQIAVSLNNSILFNNLENAYKNEVDLKQAYSRFVPMDSLKFLGKESILEVKFGDQVQKEVTIMFIDIKDYTTISEQLSPKENFDFINACLGRVGPFIYANGGFICQFLGDGLMAIFKNDAKDAVKASVAIHDDIKQFNNTKGNERIRFSVGIGLHTGKVMLGIIGDAHRMDQNVISDTVNISSRVEALTRFYDASILLTKQTLKNLPEGNGFNFRKLGKVLVKGKLKEIEIHECLDGLDEEQKKLKIETKEIFDQGLADFYKKEFTSATQKFEEVTRENPGDKAAKYFLEKSTHFSENGVPEHWTGVDKMAK